MRRAVAWPRRAKRLLPRFSNNSMGHRMVTTSTIPLSTPKCAHCSYAETLSKWLLPELRRLAMTAAATYSIILALLTALAAGLVGSFALMKRMSLAGDVISHILPCRVSVWHCSLVLTRWSEL